MAILLEIGAPGRRLAAVGAARRDRLLACSRAGPGALSGPSSVLQARNAVLVHGPSAGRTPGSSVDWASAASTLGSEAAYLDFVTRHRALGFTDFSTTMPSAADQPVLRRVAEEIIPELRAAQA
jgi:hypothetical protein